MWRRKRRVSPREAQRIIEGYGLLPARGIWHHSWHIERLCRSAWIDQRRGETHVYADQPLNEWSPIAHFTDAPDTVDLRTSKSEPTPFWTVRLSTFDTFLDRRSAASSNPQGSFPSRQTYAAAARHLNCRLENFPLAGHEERFAAWYTQLKNPKYRHSGEACWRGAVASNPGVPLDWFVVSALIDNGTGACRAVHLGIEDDRSRTGINAAAERRNGAGYGAMLETEIVRHLCAQGRAFYNCGVSGDYGGYKRRIFIDAVPTIPCSRKSDEAVSFARLFRSRAGSCAR